MTTLPVLGLLLAASASAEQPQQVAGLVVAAPAPTDKPADPAPELGWIRLETPVRGEVTIDGQPLSRDPATPILSPLERLSNLQVGHRYVIALRRAGYADTKFTLDMTREWIGGTVMLTMEPVQDAGAPVGNGPLLEATACPSGKPGFLTVDTVPPAQIYLAGVPLGETPLSKVKLPAGCHNLVARSGGEERAFSVVIEPNRVVRLRLGGAAKSPKL